MRDVVEKNSVFKAKDRERKRNERNEKKPLSESELQNLRKKNRERKRKSRKKKKAQKTESCNDDNNNVHAYQTPQALGKAVGKVKSQLPKRPRKRKTVITKLATTSGFWLQLEEAIVHVDFAENYSCTHQDEIQSAHWNQQQITLFTVAVWTINEAKDITCESHIIISDDFEHEKTSVVVFMSTVLETLVKQKHPEVTKAHIFSDGQSSQFKNKYIVSILSKLANIVQVQWNYFATSHGKGVVDGIGGTIKRLVWNASQSRRVSPVTDAKSFHEVATKLNSSVSVRLMEKKEIRDRATSLGLSKSFKEVVALPGISRFHCIEPQINGFVQSKMYSTQSMVEKEAAPLVFPFDLVESGRESDVSDMSLVEVQNDRDHDDISSSDPSAENDSNTDLVHEISDIGNEDEEKECPNDGEKESSSSITIKVDHGLPSYIPIKFESIQPSPFNVPLHTSCPVDGILSGHIKFQGNHIIDDHDLKSVVKRTTSQTSSLMNIYQS